MFRKLNEQFFVMDRQLEVTDIKTIAEAGFKAIICNRPDGEVENQPTFNLVKQEASKHDIESRCVPITSGEFTAASVEDFTKALADLPTPTLGYCRTGTRSTVLWALSEKSSGKEMESIISAGKSAGYDIANFIQD